MYSNHHFLKDWSWKDGYTGETLMADMHFMFILTFFKKEFLQSKASPHIAWQSNDTKMFVVKFNAKHQLQLNTKY